MSRAKALSVIIPGRNEQFMAHTVGDVLANSGEDTEVIAVCDGFWPNPTLDDHQRLQIIHFSEAVGQRAATNAGAMLSQAKYIMKLDAHCAVDDGFDEKLMAKMQPDWTMIPAMHRLHVFDWACGECGEREYQGGKPDKCKECGCTDMHIHMVWQPRFQYDPTVSWLFDSTLHFQYWRQHRKQETVKEQAKTGLIDTMSCIGCAWMMERERYWDLGGLDVGHGSWGQMGTELACKAWLSGGKMVTCLDTWIAHLFRTGNFARNGQSSWPYPLSQQDVDKARKHSRDLWLNNAWPKQTRPLSWLLERFWPIPGWEERDLRKQKERERDFKQQAV